MDQVSFENFSIIRSSKYARLNIDCLIKVEHLERNGYLEILIKT